MLFTKPGESSSSIFLRIRPSFRITLIAAATLALLAFLILILPSSGGLAPLFRFLEPEPALAADLTPEQQAALQAQLTEIEAEIQQQEGILSQTQAAGKSLQGDITILNAKIKAAQLKIQAHDIAIAQLGKDITVQTNTITALSTRIDSGNESLAEILQRTREIDNLSLVEALLSSQDISQFFIDVDSFTSIKQDLEAHLEDIKSAKTQNETVKSQLDDKRNQEIDLKVNVQNEQATIKKAEADKAQLLSLNKNQQKGYAAVIAQKSAQANAIRNALFQLRGTAAIKFGDAVTYAKIASSKTGVTPALILAIIQQESNLGANVGSCYLTNTVTGAGVRTSGAAVMNLMKPSRDVQPFLQITSALGRDPLKTLVSCPLDVGYGGAMGPSQFIPSTWVLFEDRIASALGITATDPWRPQDAFMATGFYMSDLGASSDSYTAQKNAACKYYSGHSCSGSNSFYGSQVMNRVSAIQNNIDILQGN